MLIAVEIFFALVSLMLAATALKGSMQAWRLESHPLDFAMRMLASLWIVFLLVSLAQVVAADQLAFLAPLPEYTKDFVYECVLVSVAFFLLTASGTVRGWILFILGLQLAGGLIATSWLHWIGPSSELARWVWITLNLFSASVVAGSIMRHTRFTHSRRSWLALSACAMGLGLWLYQAAVPGNGTHQVVPASFHLYAFFLFVVWKLISLNTDADKTLANAGTSFSGTTHLKPLASVASDDDFIALAVRGERQRISYELHDNIGSQIVSILFAMRATDQPQKRFVMLSLEQCLSDLKMLVDALDCFDESVTLALGRLRYRIQHALDRQRITMRWDVEISEELDAVRGVYAQQVLRIAQESLANVMRHANASSVKVACCYVPEFCHLMLEVRDDGVGITVDKTKNVTGHGLAGMKRRAAAIGGVLLISSGPAGGTRVRLTLPLPHVKSPRTSVTAAVKNPATA